MVRDSWNEYENYILKCDRGKKEIPVETMDKLTQVMLQAVLMAFQEEDYKYGREIGYKALGYIDRLIKEQTGVEFNLFEVWCQKEKKPMELLNRHYEVLRTMAPYYLEPFMLYVEKNRPRRERFYEPRINPLGKVVEKLQALEDDELDELFVHMPARVGKLISDDTPVFTSVGWKKHGELKVGDKVVGSDGGFTEVVAVHPKYHTTHTVIFQDGSSIDCHENHEWTIYDRRSGRYRTVETKAMIGHLKNKGRNNFLLPYKPMMDGIYREFDLPPYLLGAWLGDGTNRKPMISGDANDRVIIDKIERLGFAVEKTYIHKTTGVVSYLFGRKLVDALRKYDMCYYTHTMPKHIPVEYLTASIPQRLQLLAGLIDTDGSLTRKERRYQFTTSEEILRDDVVTLVNSFGWRVCVTEYKPRLSSSGIRGKNAYWVVSFNPTTHIPCALPRKQIYEFSRPHRMGIEAIIESEKKSGNCITVSNKDGLYAVGKNMQLTHNSQLMTLFAVWHCARDTEKSNLYVTYKEGLGGAFLDGVKEIITDPTYCFSEVFPDVKLGDTDAKNNKMDLNRTKKYKTLSGKGLESGLNGEYDAYGIMILDDILEGVQDVMSPEVLKRKQTIFDNNVMSRPKESCKIIYNGTIWATNDLFMNRLNFLENDPSVKNVRYDVIKIPALDPETDESNFDYKYGVGYSTEYYRARRAKFEMNDDLAGWWSQCQQEPIDRTGAVFNPEHMRYYSVLPEEEPLKIIAHCDVALGGGDYLSFPIIYVYENGSMYMEDVVFDNSEKHVTQPQVIAKILGHNILNVHFEANQGGEGYKDDIKRLLEEQKRKDINVSSDWAPSTMRKEQRIWDKAETIREIYFKDPQHRHKQYAMFMNNLFSFTMIHGKRKNDDAPDSLAGAIEFNINGSGVATVQAIQNPFRR